MLKCLKERVSWFSYPVSKYLVLLTVGMYLLELLT